MKRIFYYIAFMLWAYIPASTQTKVVKDSTGNYISITKVPGQPEATGKYFKHKDGTKYLVYKTSTGRLFVIRTSKSGNTYRQYLKVESK